MAKAKKKADKKPFKSSQEAFNAFENFVMRFGLLVEQEMKDEVNEYAQEMALEWAANGENPFTLRVRTMMKDNQNCTPLLMALDELAIE
jgi:hypothetical protein